MAITTKITGKIEKKNFELIRDRIGSILTAEIANQATIQVNPQTIELLQSVKVFGERFNPFDESELPAINVFTFSGQFDNKHQTNVDGLYRYFIDFIGGMAANQDGTGTPYSSFKMQRLIGIVHHILESNQWMTLGFDSPRIIHRTLVNSFQRTQEEHTQDSGNLLMYRMVFDVKSSECSIQNDSVPLNESVTDVRIDETDLGLQYIYQAP